MRILVTGSAGFIGSTLVERLLEEGHEVVGFDVYDDFYDRAIKEANVEGARAFDDFREVRADLRDPGAFDEVGEVDVVVHLAARAGVRPSIADPGLYQSVNVGGTIALMEWMRRIGSRNLVFASSSSVYGNCPTVPFVETADVDRPISPYAATKRSGELMGHIWHQLHGLSFVALRFFTAYGPRQRPDLAIHKFARRLRDGETIPMFGDGSPSRDYTYIDDVVAGVRSAIDFARKADPRYEIINLGESTTITLSRMIETLSEEMGVEPVIERLPMQPGDVDRTFADVTKARELLGYRPSTEFRDGIRSFLQWFESVGSVSAAPGAPILPRS